MASPPVGFQDTHQLGGHPVIDIAGNLTPASIRDQLSRGYYAAHTVGQHWIHQGDERVLVVGAGFAGLTAAHQLQQLAHQRQWPLRIALVDRKPGLGQPQLSCPRWVYPYLYNWPAPSHRHAAFSPEALTGAGGYGYAEGPASEVLATILDDLQPRLVPHQQLWRHDDVCLVPGAELSNLYLHREGVRVTLHAPAGVKPFWQSSERAHVVILATGFRERRGVRESDFVSHPFWGRDGLTEMNGPKQPVLVSGAGDGGIQDLFRQRTRHEDLRPLLEVVTEALDEDAFWSDLCRRASAAHARWLVAWRDRTKTDHQLHEEADGVLRDLAREVIERSEGRLQPAFANRMQAGRRYADLTFIHRCDHVAPFYPFNRFLYWLARECNELAVRPQSEIHAIAPAGDTGHACDGQTTCPAAGHQVTLREPVQCASHGGSASGEAAETRVDSAIIAVRHGARPEPVMETIRAELSDQASDQRRERAMWPDLAGTDWLQELWDSGH